MWSVSQTDKQHIDMDEQSYTLQCVVYYVQCLSPPVHLCGAGAESNKSSGDHGVDASEVVLSLVQTSCGLLLTLC